ncbi:MAG: hypothetical protein QF689_02025 [Candidatus Latescibacteria bacterium]|nr:hypothetical protein [Candidatus Latescibacterota bacterium]
MRGSMRTEVLLILGLVLAACGPPPRTVPEAAPAQLPTAPVVSVQPPPTVVGNPAAPGFDAAGSDHRAVELADRVMARLGGRAAWDSTRYVTWRFFGGRRHVWDKWTGDHRFETGDLTVLSNIHDGSGRAWQAGVEITDADTLAARLHRAHGAWINDSYWLVMPYKLKDSGVTLTYQGEGMTEEGLPAYILELTFRDVGRTPQNRYQVWVDIDNSLVRQWSFYREASDEDPRFIMPWANWQSFGHILLNDDFGAKRHTEIAVFDELPEAIFSSPEKNSPSR